MLRTVAALESRSAAEDSRNRSGDVTCWHGNSGSVAQVQQFKARRQVPATFWVDKGRWNGSDSREENMDMCLLRGLLLVALTARSLEDGKWSYSEAEGGTRVHVSMFAS